MVDVVFEKNGVIASWEPARHVVWLLIHVETRPVWTLDQLDGLLGALDFIAENLTDTKFVVLRSGASLKKTFSLGGDLENFVAWCQEQNTEKLMEYSHKAIECVYRLNHGVLHNSHCITMSLLEGNALGGGFELALSTDFIVVEHGAKLGLPEIMFNLYPGMGAYSYIRQKTGSAKLAEGLIISGAAAPLAELHSKGLLDELVPEGDGLAHINKLIDVYLPKFNGISNMLFCRKYSAPVSKEELLLTTTRWTESTLSLSEENLAYMSRLVIAQKRIHGI